MFNNEFIWYLFLYYRTIKYIYQLKITSYYGLEILLIYIYTSRLILNVYTISDLFLAASELNVEYIIQQCVQFMNQSIEKMYEKSEGVRRFIFNHLNENFIDYHS